MPEYCGMSLSTATDKISDGHSMVVVGLTGGMGVGKSVVAQALRSLGHPVFDADSAARKLYDQDVDLLRSVSDRFGPEVLKPNGTLDRLALANVVFNDAEALAELNAMVHPAVSRAFAQWKAGAEADGASLVFREAAILFESGSDQDCDVIWAVTAPLAPENTAGSGTQRLESLRNNERLAHQWPADKINASSHEVILNDGSQALVPLLLSLIDNL